MTDKKAQEYQYSRHQTRPEPFCLCVSQPFLSPSLAGEVAFNLEDREQGASARLEKNTKRQPWQPQSPSFPFKQTPIQPPACQDPEQEQGGKVTDPQLDWLDHTKYD